MNVVREALLKRELTVGTWIQTSSPVSAEILSEQGFSWVAVDCEHTDTQIAEFTSTIRGMYGRGVVPFARVRENDTLAIRQMLDMGAMGVIVPMVNSKEEAARAVAAAKYPPMGVRGFCWGRMNRWGMDFDSYAATANEDIAVVVMIESKQAVESIDDILSVDGVDGVFIGPYDMSGSYGVVGQTGHPIIKQACKTVAEACRRHGKAAGMHIVIPTEENLSQARADGYSFIAVGTDILFLQQGARDALRLVESQYR